MVKIREKSGCDSQSRTKTNSPPPAVPVFVLVCALFLTGSNFMRIVNGENYLFQMSGKPGTPGMPIFTEATPTTITLLWQPPSDDPLFPTKHYLVHTFIGLERQFEPRLTMTSVQNKFQVKGLKPSTIYSFRVASVRGDATGYFSHMSLYIKTLKEPRTKVPTTTALPTKEKSSTTTTILPSPITTTKIPRTTTKTISGTTTTIPGTTKTIPGTTTTEIPDTTTTTEIPDTTTTTKIPDTTTTTEIPDTTTTTEIPDTTTTTEIPDTTTTTEIPDTTTTTEIPDTTTTTKIPDTTTTTEIPDTTTTTKITGTTTTTTTKERGELIGDPWIVFFILVTAGYLTFCITGYYYGCRRSPNRTIERGQFAMEALDAPEVNDPLLDTPIDRAILPGTNEERRDPQSP